MNTQNSTIIKKAQDKNKIETSPDEIDLKSTHKVGFSNQKNCSGLTSTLSDKELLEQLKNGGW